MDAGTLNCPSCGGAVSDDSTRCKYCQSLLQTVACPSCFSLMFRGSKFCPHCGAKAETATPQNDSASQCPHCGVALRAVSLGRTKLEECSRCGGLWIDCGTFEQICADRDTQSAALVMTLPRPVSNGKNVRYLKCAKCDQLMNRMNYARRSGIILDICKPHGIWFDRDELRHIIEFIRAGGLDRQRQTDIEKLERERRRLEAVQQTASFGIGSDSSYSLRFGSANDTADLLSGVASILRGLRK